MQGKSKYELPDVSGLDGWRHADRRGRRSASDCRPRDGDCVGSSPHRFCPDPSCEVVYFDTEGGCYRQSDIRVPVWQKQPFGHRMVCYCFGESEDSIRAEFTTTGHSHAVERVRGHIAAGRCACEVRNPRGVCCLADLTAATKRIETVFRPECVAVAEA